jgi:hypothetical protein
MTYTEMMHLYEQASNDAMKWAKDVKGVTGKELDAYRAGFNAGWLALHGILRLHDGYKFKVD